MEEAELELSLESICLKPYSSVYGYMHEAKPLWLQKDFSEENRTLVHSSQKLNLKIIK